MLFKRLLLLFGTVSLLLFSCSQPLPNSMEIKIDIDKEEDISLLDIFEKVELVILEAADESLIKDMSKVVSKNNKYYILDYSLARILIFDESGNFLSKLDNKGNGPNEYVSLTDFEVNDNGGMMLLSNYDGVLLYFDAEGECEKKIKLPTINRTYKSFKCINQNDLVFWTFDENNRIKFYSLKKNVIVSECFPEKDNYFNAFSVIEFPYGNYISRSANNTIYEFTSDYKVKPSYHWNFGKYNNKKAKLVSGEKLFSNQTEMWNFYQEAFASENINYIFNLCGGNARYLYTQLTRKNKHINVFYDKITQEKIVFEKTSEKAKIYPIVWQDEYVIGFIPEILDMDEIIPDNILDEKNKKKKYSLTEMDNPILVKYYFKKLV